MGRISIVLTAYGTSAKLNLIEYSSDEGLGRDRIRPFGGFGAEGETAINSQAKGPGLDDTPESHLIGTDEAILLREESFR